MEDLAGIIAIISVFGFVPLIVFVAGFWVHKNRKQAQETLRRALDKGDTLTPDLVRAIGARYRSRYSDLRTGVILLCVATAIVIMGTLLPEAAQDEDAIRSMVGIAAFPGLLGAAFVGFHFFAREDDDLTGPDVA